MGPFVLHGLLWVSVQRQTDSVVTRQPHQSRQDVVVSVGADQDVGVETFKQVAHTKHKLAALPERKAETLLIDLDQQIPPPDCIGLHRDPSTGILQISVQPKGHDA